MHKLESVLRKCTKEDLTFIVGTIDSFTNLTDDKKLKDLLANGEITKIIHLIESELRYLGSADIAYFARKIIGKDPGIPIDEIITDVASKLNCKTLKPISSIEAKLERIAKCVAEKEVAKLSPEQIQELLEKLGISGTNINVILNKIKDNKALLLPVILSVAGPGIAAIVLESLLLSIVARFIGQEAAKLLLREIFSKNPWIVAWLGPLAWGASLSWLASDLQGPAYRKTIPILLYLGMVCLRDGPEEGETFWTS